MFVKFFSRVILSTRSTKIPLARFLSDLENGLFRNIGIIAMS